MNSEKTQKALKEGPVGHLNVRQTPVTMGGKMVATFIVYLVVNTLIAYLTRVALPGAAPFAKVFQVAATAGNLAYGFSFIPNAVWLGSYERTIVVRSKRTIVATSSTRTRTPSARRLETPEAPPTGPGEGAF